MQVIGWGIKICLYLIYYGVHCIIIVWDFNYLDIIKSKLFQFFIDSQRNFIFCIPCPTPAGFIREKNPKMRNPFVSFNVISFISSEFYHVYNLNKK